MADLERDPAASVAKTVTSEDVLQSSAGMAELSKKLGLLERMRGVCHSVDIPLPGIVVVGEQSAGKSSLLENISGIQFPRAQNTCTKLPCVLTLLTEPGLEEPYAQVSMDPGFVDRIKCKVSDVEEKIRSLTEAETRDQLIVDRPIYVKVIRGAGPQLSLIDLPGVTHNSQQMEDIHEVTVGLIEKYIKPEEVVICCVIPAMSDFGNAEVIKLAAKYDPEGRRTLGVVTKCDDAERAEASDVVEKVMMMRQSDVRLTLGFHCVINRSQKNIDDNMHQAELRAKEQRLFSESKRFQGLSKAHWGTERLMEKIASIQVQRVDECLPKIKEELRKRLWQLNQKLNALPPLLSTDAEKQRVFNKIVKDVVGDLQRRVRAEFIGCTEEDKAHTISPMVANLTNDFRDQLTKSNPDWLGNDMVQKVEDHVKSFASGYTVENLVGPQIFISLIKKTFIEDGLLQEATDTMLKAVAEQMQVVVDHVVERQADVNCTLCDMLAEHAQGVIDEQHAHTRCLCTALIEAQHVTSTRHGNYGVKLSEFKVLCNEHGTVNYDLPLPFQALVRGARSEPSKLAVLEVCASLHVFSMILIENFVETAYKFVKYNLVEKLPDKLEECWRVKTAAKLGDLFPMDQATENSRSHLQGTIKQLDDFNAQLVDLRICGPNGKRRRTATA
eukprot:CAMPEP_0178447154 /NCGR_PEP_ID=MMETSP0689_2-20121128/41223_1 /TAXON_ID=160604 /ORGANISM="Amphidinium massartii, Strain CS-259" /LENGTH=668 /DNA_ID=CAMNT_0020072101 /DNA_START=50 /DNA_END=2056 /DNA_ORIENTATION=-